MEDYTRNNKGIPKEKRLFVIGQTMAEFNERRMFFLMFIIVGAVIGFASGLAIGWILGKVF